MSDQPVPPLRSQSWFTSESPSGFVARSWTKNQGYPNHLYDGRPVIGICNTWSELTPCNAHFRVLAEMVKRDGITPEKPIIAATAGWVVGGSLVLAMMCDLLVAADNTKFSYPEARLGFTGGMIAGLAARIPHKVAMDIMLLGRTVDAKRGYEVGLASELVPVGTQVEVAMKQAEELANSAPLVLRTIKRFVNQHIMPKGPSELMADTIRQLTVVRARADIVEGVAAFREKRKPSYQGR